MILNKPTLGLNVKIVKAVNTVMEVNQTTTVEVKSIVEFGKKVELMNKNPTGQFVKILS